jgi:GNAT superfamily N-acetyltransferase
VRGVDELSCHTSLMRHPDHEAITTAVASWYREPAPEMGYLAERRDYGWVQRHESGGAATLVTLVPLAPADVPVVLAAIRADFPGSPVRVRIEGEAADAALRPVLETEGCRTEQAEVFLAYTGTRPDLAVRHGLTLRPIVEEEVENWTRAKQRGFSQDDADPSPEAVAVEATIRAAEMHGPGRFWLAMHGDEPAGALGCYGSLLPGDDWLVFSLATRPPFREQGVARLLLAHAIRCAFDSRARSIVINCDPEDWPQAWYRRFGFTDEVYWRRTYALAAGP